MATVERTPFQSDPHALPREAGGCLGRLLETHVGFPNRGPPASAWAVSVSLTGARLGDQASTQRFSNPFGPSKPLLFLTQFTGCVKSVPGARVRSSGRSHVEFVRRGT